MHKLVIQRDKFDKMWREKFLPNLNNLGLAPRDPLFETEAEYLKRCEEYWNPPNPPSFINYYGKRGLILLVRGNK